MSRDALPKLGMPAMCSDSWDLLNLVHVPRHNSRDLHLHQEVLRLPTIDEPSDSPPPPSSQRLKTTDVTPAHAQQLLSELRKRERVDG
jgi:hypothetical protein